MTEQLQIAFERVSRLSEAEQNRLAQMLIAYAEPQDDGEIPQEHVAAIQKGLAELDRGERFSEEEMELVFSKYGA
jgi:predicted transcriptional regulator